MNIFCSAFFVLLLPTLPSNFIMYHFCVHHSHIITAFVRVQVSSLSRHTTRLISHSCFNLLLCTSDQQQQSDQQQSVLSDQQQTSSDQQKSVSNVQSLSRFHH